VPSGFTVDNVTPSAVTFAPPDVPPGADLNRFATGIRPTGSAEVGHG
jgi:hypothetical protein